MCERERGGQGKRRTVRRKRERKFVRVCVCVCVREKPCFGCDTVILRSCLCCFTLIYPFTFLFFINPMMCWESVVALNPRCRGSVVVGLRHEDGVFTEAVLLATG